MGSHHKTPVPKNSFHTALGKGIITDNIPRTDAGNHSNSTSIMHTSHLLRNYIAVKLCPLG